nr:vicilin-like seed storage protein At2g18540 [Lolium perenne]
MWDSWDEAALEAAVEVVEADPQLVEYEAWEEAALAAAVDAHVADERRGQEAERRGQEAERRLRVTEEARRRRVARREDLERQREESERRQREETEFLEAWRWEAASERRWERRREQGWEDLLLRRSQREETQIQEEVCERRRLAELQLRLQRLEVDHRRWREDLERQLRQEAVAADRAAYLTFVAERAGDYRRRSGRESRGETTGESSSISIEPSGH